MTEAVHLFLAYRNVNEPLRDQLLAAMQDLQASDWGKDHPFEVWSDNLLLGVAEWEAEVALYIDHADLFLLLVTTALDGGYALDVELVRAAARARAGKSRIIPVVCDDVLGFLGAAGLEEFRLNRIPKRGIGLSHPPYNGHLQAWLDDVVQGIKLAVLRVYNERQATVPELSEAAKICEAAAEDVKEAAQGEQALLGFRGPGIAYAAERVHDLLAWASPNLLDLMPTVIPHLRNARRLAREAGATATLQCLERLTARMDDLEGAARLAGMSARADPPGSPLTIIDAKAPANTGDVSKLGGALDAVEWISAGLAEEAAAAPADLRAGLEDAASRLGADSRLVRATSEAAPIDASVLQAASNQLAGTMRTIATIPSVGSSDRTLNLLRAAGDAVTKAIRYVARLVARAFGWPVPSEPESNSPDELWDLRSPRPSSSAAPLEVSPYAAPPKGWLDPGARWVQVVPALDRRAWPQMVTLPPGRVVMGSPLAEERRADHESREQPQHGVQLGYIVALGRTPVSVDAFAAFVEDAGYNIERRARVWNKGEWKEMEGRGWSSPGFPQTGDHPVTCVSWRDARAYIDWLNEKLRLTEPLGAYRLPSEAEWEYGCRAGTTTPFSFGATISTQAANYDGNFAYGGGPRGMFRERTTPAGAFPPNAFGLHDMHGNVWEWCEDAWHETYTGAPSDGSAWVEGDASRRVVRGGSWNHAPQNLRSACRSWDFPSAQSDDAGFRLARTLSRSWSG